MLAVFCSIVDATEVRLDDKVRKLLGQAAKYWGLDENKVFFLDHDHRIVPDGMVLGLRAPRVEGREVEVVANTQRVTRKSAQTESV